MAPKFFELDDDLRKEVGTSERCPFEVPNDAVVTGDKARWSEVVTVIDTTYEEKKNDDDELIAKCNIQFRPSEQHSEHTTNVGKKFTSFNQVNFTQLKTRTKDGQVQMSVFSLRRVAQLLQAVGMIEKREQMKSPGEFLWHETSEPSKLAGMTVRVQIEQSLDNNGELQQQVRRFTPFEG